VISKYFRESDFFRDGKPLNEYIWVERTNWNFDELILSWNARRPVVGKLRFYVSVYHSGSWSPWQVIAEWGSKTQRTYVNKVDNVVSVKHVRLELSGGIKAANFRVKIVAFDGASLSLLKALFVSLSNLSFFSVDDVNSLSRSLSTFSIEGVARQSQMVVPHNRFPDLCSPTSISIVLHFLMTQKFSSKGSTSNRAVSGFPDNISGNISDNTSGSVSQKFAESDFLASYIAGFAEKVHDDSYLDIYGNWLLNVAQAYDASNGAIFFRVERMNSFLYLYKKISSGIPIAVSIRGFLDGAPKDYKNGHFVVVVGYDSDQMKVLCIDPAFASSEKSFTAYKFSDFISAWGKSKNLCYVPIVKG
jgi:hypothetical protein